MSENRTYDTDYTLRAHDVFILSQSEPFPPAPSHLCIASLGSNDLLKDGSVKVSATGQITLNCGPTFIGIDASVPTASVVVANGLPGAITLTQGIAPGAPEIKITDLPPSISATVGPDPGGAAVKLTATGVGIKYGPPPAGPDIELGPQGIALKYGPPGAGSSIEIGPDGITLKSGPWSAHLGPAGFDVAVGPNKVGVSPQGVAINGLKLDLEAMTNLTLQGLQVQQTAAIKSQEKAAITIIG